MIDSPTMRQIFDTLTRFLESDISRNIKRNVRLQSEIMTAIQLLKIAERELALSIPYAYAEWERLNGIQGTDIAPPDATKVQDALTRRNEALAEGIRQGKYDDTYGQAALLAHFLVTTQEQLEIVNPRYLQGLAQTRN